MCSGKTFVGNIFVEVSLPTFFCPTKIYGNLTFLYSIHNTHVLYLNNQLTSRHVPSIDSGRLHRETGRVKFSDLLSCLKYLYKEERGQRTLLWEWKVCTIVESSWLRIRNPCSLALPSWGREVVNYTHACSNIEWALNWHNFSSVGPIKNVLFMIFWKLRERPVWK